MTGPLITRTTAAADAELVIVEGTVGALDADELRGALHDVARDGARRVVVDLAAASIDDPAGLAGLYDLARVVRGRDGLVAIACPPRHELRTILAATGLDAAFTLYDSRRAALDDLDLDG